MKTYGVWSKDLKAYALTEKDLETARRYYTPGMVVCEEESKTVGVELVFRLLRYWHWDVCPRWQYASLGFLSLGWRRLRRTLPVRIIYYKAEEAANSNAEAK